MGYEKWREVSRYKHVHVCWVILQNHRSSWDPQIRLQRVLRVSCERIVRFSWWIAASDVPETQNSHDFPWVPTLYWWDRLTIGSSNCNCLTPCLSHRVLKGTIIAQFCSYSRQLIKTLIRNAKRAQCRSEIIKYELRYDYWRRESWANTDVEC